MSSLYAAYIKEREDFGIIEDGSGFITYKVFGEELYIRDIFVAKEHRRSSVGMDYFKKVYEIAKESGCKIITGTVSPNANNATDSMKAIFAAGFKIHSINSSQQIVLIREVV